MTTEVDGPEPTFEAPLVEPIPAWESFWGRRLPERAPGMLLLIATLAVTALLPVVDQALAPFGGRRAAALDASAASLAALVALWAWLSRATSSWSGRWVAASFGPLALLFAGGAAWPEPKPACLALLWATTELWLGASWAVSRVRRSTLPDPAGPRLRSPLPTGLALVLPPTIIGGWWLLGSALRLASGPRASLGTWMAIVLVAYGALVAGPRAYRDEPSFLSFGIWMGALPLATGMAVHLVLVERGLPPWRGERLGQVAALTLVAAGLALDDRLSRLLSERRDAQARALSRGLHQRTLELLRLDQARSSVEARAEQLDSRLRLLERAVETMSLGLTITDTEGRIVFVNEADASLHGWSRHELLGRRSSVYAEATTPVESMPPEKGPWGRERFNVRRDGSIFPVRLTSDAVSDDQGRYLGMITICEDVDEEWRLRRTLETRDRVLTALSSAAETVLVSGAWGEGITVLLARIGESMDLERVRLVSFRSDVPDFAWLAGEGEAPPPHHRFWEELRPRLASEDLFVTGLAEPSGEGDASAEPPSARRAAVLAPVRVGNEVRAVLSAEAESSQRPWAEAELEAIRLVARFIAAAFRRRDAEAALVSGERRYRELVEQSSDLILSLGPAGDLLLANRAWKEALGYGDDDVARLTIWDVVAPGHHDAWRRLVDESRRGCGSFHLTMELRSHDGRPVPVEGAVSAHTGADGVTHTIAFFRDISERLAVERVKEEFLAMVSHELRTPLTSILGSLDLVRSGRLTVPGPEASELLEVASRNGDRLLRLVNDLLELQRAAAGKIQFRLGPVQVNRLVDAAVDDLRPAARRQGVRLICDPIPTVDVYTDQDRASQILLNLLANAIKFSPQGGEVHLSVQVEGAEARIAVIDQGPGISPADRAHLFDRFHQLHVKDRSRPGFGLGLAIAKELASGLGARIEVESQLGEGSTFAVALPLSGGSSRPSSPPS